jgi:hypothetical protein
MQAKRWFLSLAFVVSATGLGACGRAHLSSNYAQAYTAWFTAQHVKSKPGSEAEARKIIESLDAQEAGAVSKTYRKAVSRGEEQPGSGSRLLMIGTQRGGGAEGGYLPPPSVPQ